MEKYCKNYLLTKFKVFVIKGLSRVEQDNIYGALSCYGKCIFICDMLFDLFEFDFSLEKDCNSKHLTKLFDEFHSKLLEVIYG